MTGLFAFAAFVLSIIAWRRTSTATPARVLLERIQSLEGQVEQLRLALRDLRARAHAEGEAPPLAVLAADESPAPDALPVAPLRPAPPAAEATPLRVSQAPNIPPRTPAVPPAPPKRSAPPIDLEQWLGVRGAAVAGGIVLALAAIYFLRYSIEAGLFPPPLRVAIGGLVGLGCVVASESRRVRARYARTADALGGAGIVILYAAFWAARVLYGLIPTGFAFAGMIGVTAACAVLAYRREALVIAVLGLAGGFATPLLLSTGQDRPIGLFGYLLLLDLALLALARKRNWPGLALASLIGTALYQVFWIVARVSPEKFAIGLGVLGAFAALFACATLRLGTRAPAELRATQAAGVLFPFALALYLASRSDLNAQLWPLALLLLPLATAAAWIARVRGDAWIGTSAASASSAVLLAFALSSSLDGPRAWELALVSVALAAIFHAFALADRDKPLLAGPGLAAAIAAFGGLCIVIPSSLAHVGEPFTPWLSAFLALTALSLRHGMLPARGFLQPAAAVLLSFALAAHATASSHFPNALSLELRLALELGVALALQWFAARQRGRAAHEWSEHAAAAFAAVALFGLLTLGSHALAWPLALAAPLAFGVLMLACATRLGGSSWPLAAVASVALAHTGWTFDAANRALPSSLHAGVLAFQLASSLVFAFWPFAAGVRALRSHYSTWASALAPLLWFPSLLTLWRSAIGGFADGLPAVALAAVGLAAARLAQRQLPPEDAARRRTLVWQLAIALAFVAAAIPLQLDKEWITIGWALEGTALVWLWRRFDHPGLKWIAFGLFAAVTSRLLLNPALLGYHGASSIPFINWLLYTYLVPAACLLVAARWLAPDEVARAREFERPFYGERPWLALSFAIAALVVVFAWLNLAIIDAFQAGGSLSLDLARKPARDLSISLAWGAYALALLALGVRRASRGLRWASLALMMITIGKVFLYDLGELEDLYRVGSLLGLAFSLIAVSLAYQRFVFRQDAGRSE